MPPGKTVYDLLLGFKQLRERAGITAEAIDRRLLLGPGWTTRFETGEVLPGIDVLLAMLQEVGADPGQFLSSVGGGDKITIVRGLYALPDDDGLLLHFRYGDHDAVYRLRRATLAEFHSVLRELQDGLALLAREDGERNRTAIQTDAVVRTFLRAVKTWPDANPSDLWWFLVYRAYCDAFNHPASNARRDLGQSWKRTGGWALEEILVRHYGPFLKSRDVNLFVGRGQHKLQVLAQLSVRDRLEPDKVDVLLTTTKNGSERCFGVVHVKASFAERRTDDVPMSKALVEAGYTSPLWTMDCKSFPSKEPINRGELGVALTSGKDKRSAKRKDIEEDAYFSACFSYNANTIPTPDDQQARARIVVCSFKNPDDDFSRFVVAESERFKRGTA